MNLTTVRDHDLEAKKEGQDDVVIEDDDHLDDFAPDNSHIPPFKDDDSDHLEGNEDSNKD